MSLKPLPGWDVGDSEGMVVSKTVTAFHLQKSLHTHGH